MNKKTKLLLKFGSLAALTATGICCFNKYITYKARKNKGTSADTLLTYNWKFGQIRYTKSGNGTPLLLVHDLNSQSSHHEWDSVRPLLEKNHTVYAVDLLGCGESDKPKFTYTNYLYVGLISEFIKNVIGGKTDIIASGLSASFTIMANLTDKNIFHKIMLINPTDPGELNQIASIGSKLYKTLLELPIIGTMLYYIKHTKKNTELYYTEQAFYNPFTLTNSITSHAYDDAHTCGASGKYLEASLATNYLNCNIFHACRAMESDMCILGGIQQKNIQEIITHYRSINPSIDCAYVSKSKAFPHIENVDETIEKIKLFF